MDLAVAVWRGRDARPSHARDARTHATADADEPLCVSRQRVSWSRSCATSELERRVRAMSASSPTSGEPELCAAFAVGARRAEIAASVTVKSARFVRPGPRRKRKLSGAGVMAGVIGCFEVSATNDGPRRCASVDAETAVAAEIDMPSRAVW